jgi:hypothetical protein
MHLINVQVLRLQDEVESLFTKHFASNDQKIARITLKPQQNKDSHAITFFAGKLISETRNEKRKTLACLIYKTVDI